jgi:DNA-binding ferritin-like protein
MATAAGEDGLADFLAGRMDAHRKHSWQLRATLG